MLSKCEGKVVLFKKDYNIIPVFLREIFPSQDYEMGNCYYYAKINIFLDYKKNFYQKERFLLYYFV